VTQPLDEDLVQRIDDLGPTRWSGTCYRHVSGQRDPLSGVGARLIGGRWNPSGISTVYLALPAHTCVAELDRLAASQNVTTDDLLRATPGRTLSTVVVRDLAVLDLRDPSAREQVGLDLDDIADDDRTACQAVGQSADFLQLGGVLAPSATGGGLVCAVFESRVAPGQLSVAESRPLTEELYRELNSSHQPDP